MNYAQLIIDLSTLLVVPSDNADFQAILPALIDDAEQRIYRELDFLSTRFSSSTGNFITGSRYLNAPAISIVVEALAVITPVGSTVLNGNRVQLERVSADFIDSIWPTVATTGVPQYYAMATDIIVAVAPTPDANYTAEFTGTLRPTPISASNTTTWLATHLPDLFLSACMVFGAGYLRDYGQSSDDPTLAISWENRYQDHKKSAIEEEQRRKSQSTNWSPYSTVPLSNPRT